jgi:hypothetical protein
MDGSASIIDTLEKFKRRTHPKMGLVFESSTGIQVMPSIPLAPSLDQGLGLASQVPLALGDADKCSNPFA